MINLIKSWHEGQDTLDLPGLNVQAKPTGPLQQESDEGVILGNLGAKVVGTLSAWIVPDGFLNRVKNPEMLEKGVADLYEAIQKFNRLANRITARSATESRALREIQTPYFFTLGKRLGDLGVKGKGDRAKALEQLAALAPKMEAKWNKFTGENALGVRVTNPEIIPEPTGAPEGASQATGPVPPAPLITPGPPPISAPLPPTEVPVTGAPL